MYHRVLHASEIFPCIYVCSFKVFEDHIIQKTYVEIQQRTLYQNLSESCAILLLSKAWLLDIILFLTYKSSYLQYKNINYHTFRTICCTRIVVAISKNSVVVQKQNSVEQKCTKFHSTLSPLRSQQWEMGILEWYYNTFKNGHLWQQLVWSVTSHDLSYIVNVNLTINSHI